MQYQQRMNLGKVEPKGYGIMFKFEEFLSKTAIPARLINLLKIRASQINKCSFCIELHSSEALAAGESAKRIFALSAWKESPYFSEEEKVVLALTEEVTLISDHGVSDEVYGDALRLFGEQYVAQLILATNTINSWNRIAISTRLMPE